MRWQDTAGWSWSYNNIKVHSKSEFVSLKLHRDYSNLLTLSNVGKLITTISKSRKRKKQCVICLHLHNCCDGGLRVWVLQFMLFFLCVCPSFLVRFFLGCLSFPDLEGSVFSRFGVNWVPEVFSQVQQGAFHLDHFWDLTETGNRAWKTSGIQGRFEGV